MHESALARALDRPWVALAAYAALTAIFTFPLAFRLGSHLPLGAGDLWVNLWDLWWWKTAIFELGISPYHTDYLFYPVGVSLATHAHSPLNMLAMLPVSLAFGVDAAYGIALLLGFWLGGFNTYLLVRYLTGEPRAAFVAGGLYTFAPMHMEQSLEHLNIASVQFIPLFALFVLRLCREGGRANAVGLGLTFAANALLSWYHGLIALPVGVALVVREWIAPASRSARALSRDLLLAAGVALACVLPFVWPMLGQIALGETAPVQSANSGVDPVFWLLPSDHHPLFGGLTADFYREYRRSFAVGFLAYLGFVPLALCGAALLLSHWSGERRRVWAVMALGFLVLSLGSALVVMDREFFALPHALFDELPLLSRLRVANRFQLWAFLPLAVLSGLTLSAVFRGSRPWWGWSLAALIALEFLWLPYPLQTAPRHHAIEALAAEPGIGAVLPIPLPVDARFSQALYDQIRHGRPIVGGYVSYNPGERLGLIRTEPFLAASARGRPAARGPDFERLRAAGVEWIVLHLDWGILPPSRTDDPDYYVRRAARLIRPLPGPVLSGIRGALRAELGPPALHDDLIEIYRLP